MNEHIVWSLGVEFQVVPQRRCCSIFLSILDFFFGNKHWSLFYTTIKFGELTVETNWHCYAPKKKRISLNHVSRIRLTEFNIFYNNASLRNNVTKSLIAMLIRIIHIYSLCLNTVCHEKHVIWTYLTFLNTFHVFSMAL